MKKLLFIAAAMTVFAACHKPSSSSSSSTLRIPWNLDSLMPTKTTPATPAPISGVEGLFVACNVSGDFTDTSGVNYAYRRSWEDAQYPDSTLSVVTNGFSLHEPLYLLYPTYPTAEVRRSVALHDTGNVWKEAATNYWMVDAAPSPATCGDCSAEIGGRMPQFYGALPAMHDTTQDFNFTFDASNCADADSAYIVFHLNGNGHLTHCVSTNGGTVHVAASTFSTFPHPQALGSIYTIDGRFFKGDMAAVVLYNTVTKLIHGKPCAFVQQRVVLSFIKYY